MTIQNLFVAELTDILRVQITCASCGAHVSYDPDKPSILPDKCPQLCGTEWKPTLRNLDQKIVKDFLEIIQQARAQQRASEQIKIQLVFQQASDQE